MVVHGASLTPPHSPIMPGGELKAIMSPGRVLKAAASSLLLLLPAAASSADEAAAAHGAAGGNVMGKTQKMMHGGRQLGAYKTPYPDPAFYTNLTAYCYKYDFSNDKVWTKVMEEDLTSGTMRIRKPGCYYLGEDIAMEPNEAATDYWPKFKTSNPNHYPMGQFGLGFTSAFSIETTDVLFDLNGFEIKQSFSYVLKQRFFNTFMLTSRVFEAHDGMPNLNLQNGETLYVQGNTDAKLAADPADPLGEIAELMTDLPEAEKLCPPVDYLQQKNLVPKRVVIRNGIIGATSHNCVLGNGGPEDILIEDVVCREFEVAGIQINGGKNVTLRRLSIGPNSRPHVLGNFASVRFIGFFFAFYWRHFFTNEEIKLLMKENYMTFDDRPGYKVSLWDVFARLFIMEQVYVHALEGIDKAPNPAKDFPPTAIHNLKDDPFSKLFQEADDIFRNPARKTDLKKVLDEADRTWGNPSRLPDGGVIYGINLHRRRKGVHKLGESFWNFYGPDEDSTTNVRIYNVTIRDIKSSPVQIPAVGHSQGGVLQGVTGDVLRIGDIMDYPGQFSMKGPARYKGNPHSDAIFAFYKLSHDLWQFSFFNLTIEQTYDDDHFTCGNDPFIDAKSNITCPPPLVPFPTGKRACDNAALLQKRLFGSPRLSVELFKWATQGLPNGAEDLFKANPDPKTRKDTQHRIVCGGDTMFHSVKGSIPLKIDFANDVIVDGLTILNVTNLADSNNWLCDHEWAYKDGYNKVGPATEKSYAGGDVRAAVVTKSFKTKLQNIRIDYLESREGRTVGVDLIGDDTGRSMYRPEAVPSVTLGNLAVGGHLRAGQPGYVHPLLADTNFINLGGFTSNDAANLQNKWRAPKVTLTLFGESYGNVSASLAKYLPDYDVANALRAAGINADALKAEAAAYFASRFGIDEDKSQYAELKGVPVDLQTYVQVLCFGEDESCQGPYSQSKVLDVYYSLPIDPTWLIKGAYAPKSGGIFLSPGYEVRVGAYIIPQSKLCADPLVMRYFSVSPEPTVSAYKGPFPLQRAVDYALYSDTFEHGWATGTHFYQQGADASTVSYSASVHITFNDLPKNFQLVVNGDGRLPAAAIPPKQVVMSFDVVADAKIQEFGPVDEEVTPLKRTYYLENEAGVKDMRRWLKEDDDKLFARRDAFITYVTTTFKDLLPFPLPPKELWPNESLTLDNSFFGFVPYTESHHTDLRVVSGVGIDNEVAIYNFTRVIEVGFKWTGLGAPFPSPGVVKQGVYIFENCTATGTDYLDPYAPCACLATYPRINFATTIPSNVNDINQAFVFENVSLVDYPTCQGTYQAVSIQGPPKDQNAVCNDDYYRIAGSFKFYGKGCEKAMADGYKKAGY